MRVPGAYKDKGQMASLRMQFVRIGIAGFALTAISSAQMSVTLTPSQPSPAPLATVITWSASVPDSADGNVWYRFRVREGSGDYAMIRDFSPISSLDWTAADHEGLYEMEVSAKNRLTGESAATTSVYRMLSRVASGGGPVISPTAHPLVYLYSAACPAGSRMKVQFQSWDGIAQETPFKACQAAFSTNFYLAGLRGNTAYMARHIIETDGKVSTGPDILFGM